MLGIQLNFSGDRLVTCNGVVVGIMADDNTEDGLGVLRILMVEYTEQIKLIKEGLNQNKNNIDYVNSVSLLQGELIVSVRWPNDEFRGLCEKYCFPMKIDNLIFTYVKCRNSYVIKQSVVYIKSELKKLGVIR